MNMTKNYNIKDYRKREYKTIKRVIIIMLLLTISITLNTNTVNANSYNTGYKINKSVAVKYCKKHYKNYRIKIVNEYKVPKYRKSNKIIYIEHVKTISKGKYGITKDGYKIRYNKPVRKNKKHVVYLIYNPKTNYVDDIIVVISNNKVR